MTDNGELQQRKHESNEVHLERLKGILRERRAQAQAELELKLRIPTIVISGSDHRDHERDS